MKSLNQMALGVLALGLWACDQSVVASAEIVNKDGEVQAQKIAVAQDAQALLPETWTVLSKAQAKKVQDKGAAVEMDNPIFIGVAGAQGNVLGRLLPSAHFIDDWQGETSYMLLQMDYNGNGTPEATYVIPALKEASLKEMVLAIQDELKHPNKQMRKRPEVVFQAWDDLISEHLSEIQNNPLHSDHNAVEMNPLFAEAQHRVAGVNQISPELQLAIDIDNAMRGDAKKALFGIVLALNNTKKDQPSNLTASSKENAVVTLATLLENAEKSSIAQDLLIQSAFKIIRANYSSNQGVLPKELMLPFAAIEQFTLSTAALLLQDQKVGIWGQAAYSNDLWTNLAKNGKIGYKIGGIKGKAGGLLGAVKGAAGGYLKGLGGGNLSFGNSREVVFGESSMSVTGGSLKLQTQHLPDPSPLLQTWALIGGKWKCKDKCLSQKDCKEPKGSNVLCGSTDHL